jgi:uncharacterized protein (DUF1697 family)
MGGRLGRESDQELTMARGTSRHIAFLRAINVGGHIVKMDRLREIFTSMGLGNVETFIQSGNVVFESGKKPEDLEATIETRLAKVLGYPVATFIRTPAELREIVKCAPYTPAEQKAAANIMIGFLRAPLPADARQGLAAFCGPIHEFRPHGREIYWLRRELGDFKDLSKSKFDKATTVTTFRSVTTVAKMVAKYCAD